MWGHLRTGQCFKGNCRGDSELYTIVHCVPGNEGKAHFIFSNLSDKAPCACACAEHAVKPGLCLILGLPAYGAVPVQELKLQLSWVCAGDASFHADAPALNYCTYWQICPAATDAVHAL